MEADGSLHLALRVGREKLYVVKNLTELVDTVESHGEMQLGTKHVLSFASDRLDDEAQVFYRFIKKEVKTAEMRNAELQQRYGQELGSLKASIPLYGRALDEFFTLMEAKRFPFTDRSRGAKRSGEAGYVRKSPKIELCMVRRSDASGGFEGIELNGRLPKLVNGTDYIYFFDGENLSRADDENTLEELETLIDLTKADPKDFVKGDMEIPAYRALYLDKVLEKNEAFYAKRDQNFKHLVKEFKTISDSEYEIPESLQGVMRNYQEFGYKWLRTIEAYQFGGILADDMGLGKTLQVISALLAAKEEGRLGTALVVTPASLVCNWKEEFAKFAPQLSVAVTAGSKGEREEQIHARERTDVAITSYDLLKRDILFYADQSFAYQIIDEAQSIKTHTTAAAKAVKAVRSKIRFALTEHRSKTD